MDWMQVWTQGHGRPVSQWHLMSPIRRIRHYDAFGWPVSVETRDSACGNLSWIPERGDHRPQVIERFEEVPQNACPTCVRRYERAVRQLTEADRAA
jgi:hypothetical protein